MTQINDFSLSLGENALRCRDTHKTTVLMNCVKLKCIKMFGIIKPLGNYTLSNRDHADEEQMDSLTAESLTPGNNRLVS